MLTTEKVTGPPPPKRPAGRPRGTKTVKGGRHLVGLLLDDETKELMARVAGLGYEKSAWIRAAIREKFFGGKAYKDRLHALLDEAFESAAGMGGR